MEAVILDSTFECWLIGLPILTCIFIPRYEVFSGVSLFICLSFYSISRIASLIRSKASGLLSHTSSMPWFFMFFTKNNSGLYAAKIEMYFVSLTLSVQLAANQCKLVLFCSMLKSNFEFSLEINRYSSELGFMFGLSRQYRSIVSFDLSCVFRGTPCLIRYSSTSESSDLESRQ